MATHLFRVQVLRQTGPNARAILGNGVLTFNDTPKGDGVYGWFPKVGDYIEVENLGRDGYPAECRISQVIS